MEQKEKIKGADDNFKEFIFSKKIWIFYYLSLSSKWKKLDVG